MKKFIALLIVAAMVLAVPITAHAAGASLSGPDVIRAGDTITLTFYASGNISGIVGEVTYDESALTLQSYSHCLGGNWDRNFNGNNFLYMENNLKELGGNAAVFTATFQVNANVAPGTSVSVSVSATLSNSEGDQYSGTSTWTKTVAEPLSDNALLASLVVSNATISPAFNPNTTEYTASVPYTTSKLQVTATAEHSGAKVTIGSTALTENATTDVQVTVTAENGTKKVYHIRVARPRDPNYVESKINTLSELSVENFFISPAFTPERLAYAVYLPYETDSIQLNAKTTDNKAKVKLPTIQNIPVGETTYEIPVTAENGDVKVYTITVFRAETFLPEVEIQETEPVTEPTEETTVPTTEATEPTTVPTTQATEPQPTEPVEEDHPERTIVIGIFCMIISFLCGVLIPMLLRRKKKSQ